MARHRNIRTLDFEDEFDGYHDVFGYSVEDEFCVSPRTEQRFMYNRDNTLSSIGCEDDDVEDNNSLQDSFSRSRLSEEDKVKLNSCLEEIQNVLGDSIPESFVVSAIIKNDFNMETSLNTLLNSQEAAFHLKASAKVGMGLTEETSFEKLSIADEDDSLSKAKGNDISLSIGTADSAVALDSVSEVNTACAPTSSTLPKPDLNLLHAPLSAVPTSVRCDSPGSRSPRSSRSPARPETEFTPKSVAKIKHDKAAALSEYQTRHRDGRQLINLVVIGHVDAGKSTLMGHLLLQLGFVNQRLMHRYKQDSKKMGKSSFAYAWVLDETEEERLRGVTIDVAQTKFETKSKIVTLLDAPGHKDFIPNMITGAAQADSAVLVINATTGEFESGFETGGQTREHTMLIRSLGVSQLVVAVNKMDTIEWSNTRFIEIKKKLSSFLKHVGFSDQDVAYVPVSGLLGENLAAKPTHEGLAAWYNGPTLTDLIDNFKSPDRDVGKALRICISDVYKGVGSGLCIAAFVISGSVAPGDRLLLMPQGEVATIKSILIDDGLVSYAFAGDSIGMNVIGVDVSNIGVGCIMCDPAKPVAAVSRVQARIVVFNIVMPITRGFPVIAHYLSVSEPAHIRKLVSLLNKNTGAVVRSKPRCLTKNSSAIVELEFSRPISIEEYKECKDLGRFMLRSAGITIAAGLVTKIITKAGEV